MTVKDYFDKKENASRRGWMLLRCELQNQPTDEGELNKDAGEKLLNAFFSVFEEDTKDGVDNAEKIDKKALNSAFQSFLSEREQEKDWWGENLNLAKNAISHIHNYRDSGVLDTNIIDEVLTHAKFINNDPLRYIYELIQNADDCEYDAEIKPKMEIEISHESMTVSYPEKGMTCSDILAITTIGESNKGKKKKKKQIIGEKGRGFKTIFSVCSSVDIYSGFYRFTLTDDSFCPEWIEEPEIQLTDGRCNGTTMILHFRNKIVEKEEKTVNKGEKITKEIETENFMKDAAIFDDIVKKYGVKDGKISYGDMLQSCPILFTNNIRKLLIRKKDSSKKLSIETKFGNNDNDGEISIVYKWTDKGGVESEYSMECLRVKKETVFDYEEYNSRYKDIFTEEEYNKEREDNSKVICYESVAVVPLIKAEENKIIQGKLYSYLPTDINLSAPIAFHIPFELNEDRSCMYIKGMLGNPHDDADYCDEISGNRTTKWNHKLFEAAFCHSDTNKCLLQLTYEAIKEKFKNEEYAQERILAYLPDYTKEKTFFVSGKDVDSKETAQAEAKRINDFCKALSQDGKEDAVYECIKKQKLFRSLCNEEIWLSVNDGPIMFDETVTGIIRKTADSTDSDNNIKKLLNCISESSPEESGKDKIIPFLNDNRLENLGLSRINIQEPAKKTIFSNALLDMDYDAVMDELFKQEKRSSYLSNPKSDKELKIIWIDKEHKQERLCIGTSVVWVEDDEELELAKNYPNNVDIAVFVPDWNPKLSDHKELIERFAERDKDTGKFLKNIWDKWKTDKVKETCTSPDHLYVSHTHSSFSFEQFIRLMDLFRCICKSDEKDWYSFMSKCFLEKKEYEEIGRALKEGWEKMIGTKEVHMNSTPSFDIYAYEKIRDQARELDKKEVEE